MDEQQQQQQLTAELPHTHALFERKPLEAHESSGIRICGITTPAAVDRPSAETIFTTVEDVDKLCKDVIGVPLFDEHEVGEVIGRVARAYPDAEKRIVVEVDIADTLPGWTTIQRARKGDRIGFSWGATRALVPDNKLVVAAKDKRMFELSITSSPEFSDDALITEVSKNSHMHDAFKKRLIQDIQTRQHAVGLSNIAPGGLVVGKRGAEPLLVFLPPLLTNLQQPCRRSNNKLL